MKGKSAFLMKLTLFVLAVSAIISSITLIEFDTPITWTFFSLSVIFSVLALIEVLIAQKNIKKYVLKMDKDIYKTERDSLYHFPLLRRLLLMMKM